MCMRTIKPELALFEDVVAMKSNASYDTMENRMMRRRVQANGAAINGSYNKANLKRPQQNQHPEYFTVEWVCAVLFLTASLLLLPLFLPPLPPPPFLLLFVPVVIMILLLFLAFMPSDVRNVASSYS